MVLKLSRLQYVNMKKEKVKQSKNNNKRCIIIIPTCVVVWQFIILKLYLEV